MTIFSRMLIGGLAIICAGAANAENLVIMHTNDTHSQIDPFDTDGMGGVARRKALIDSIRGAEANTLLVDAGDIVQGTLFFNLYQGEVEEKLMNALDYDIRILGNHEFDNGLGKMAANLKMANAALLGANYDFRQTPLDGLFKPYKIYDVDSARIAFMPINLQPKGMISDRNYEGMGYLDYAEYADKMAWYLKNIENADMVIAVSHVGYSPDTALVAASSNIDAVIGGHSHTTVDPADPSSPPHIIKNADGKDVLVAQAGKGGRYLGEITVDLSDLGSTPKYRLIPVDARLDSRSDGSVEAIVAPYREEIEALNHKYVTSAPADMPKDGQALLNFVADYAFERCKELYPGVDFAFINKGGIRNDIPKGPVSEGQVITLMPFYNRLQVIEISGKQLLEAFDTMASQYGQGVSENVKAEYRGGKCVNVTIDGKRIDPNGTYYVGTIDYVANGGDYFSSLVDHKTVAESDKYLFDDLLDYFKNGKGKGKEMKANDKVRMKKI
ncbi:MAG: bifunctional metallophosphatase/5'-nucleotidase [Clostridium sp.]|nr:bifunctional metallophosphatase/5'-nucleotidase [Clostridium sp.]